MTLLKRVGLLLLAGTVWLGGIECGAWLSSLHQHNFVSISEAIVGRPLTPVSVAGVARRTVRRCAAGVYNCSISDPQSLDRLLGLTNSESIRS